jgi:hypothetical protein
MKDLSWRGHLLGDPSRHFVREVVMRLAILLIAVALIRLSSVARATNEPVTIGGQSMMDGAKHATEAKDYLADTNIQKVPVEKVRACQNLMLTCTGDKSTATKCCPAGYQSHCPKASITCN